MRSDSWHMVKAIVNGSNIENDRSPDSRISVPLRKPLTAIGPEST